MGFQKRGLLLFYNLTPKHNIFVISGTQQNLHLNRGFFPFVATVIINNTYLPDFLIIQRTSTWKIMCMKFKHKQEGDQRMSQINPFDHKFVR